jgi:hypothetical protein
MDPDTGYIIGVSKRKVEHEKRHVLIGDPHCVEKPS